MRKLVLAAIASAALGFGAFVCYRLSTTTPRELLATNPIYIRNLSPIEFLDKLKKTDGVRPPEVTVVDGPREGWITEKDLPHLAAKLDSKIPCLNIKSLISSSTFTTLSTEGEQAHYMFYCFSAGRYPSGSDSSTNREDEQLIKMLQERHIKFPDPKTWQ